jgi:integrase
MGKSMNGNGSGRWKDVKGVRLYEFRVTLPNGARRSYYGKTQKVAVGKAKAAIKEIEQGGRTLDKKTTVEQYLEGWLAGRKPELKPNGYRSYETAVRLHINPAIGKIKLAKLQPSEIRSMLAKMVADGAAPGYADSIRRTLRKALNDAVGDDLILKSPLRGVKAPLNDKAPVVPLSTEEVNALLAVTKDTKLHPLFVTALGLGLRLGELLALSWDDVDFEKDTLRVQFGLALDERKWVLQSPKSKTSRRVLRMPETVSETLRAHRQAQRAQRLALHPGIPWGGSWDREFVFTTGIGTPINASNLTHRTFKPLVAKAGITRNVRFHDLRHTCASLYASQGATLHELKTLLGHAQISLTADLYTHFMEEQGERMAAAMDGVLEGMV